MYKCVPCLGRGFSTISSWWKIPIGLFFSLKRNPNPWITSREVPERQGKEECVRAVIAQDGPPQALASPDPTEGQLCAARLPPAQPSTKPTHLLPHPAQAQGCMIPSAHIVTVPPAEGAKALPLLPRKSLITFLKSVRVKYINE